ncbi:MAG: hypothetical protein B6I36_02355 [Desulfobacteraceae bacterium 4572_35.1]|nr:MAG: hypothetical protein B6I36_02355 [Desulfobacteraceae bacterium 4572_35.1]
MAKKKNKQPEWPQHCEGLVSLKHIDVAQQVAILRIGVEVIIPLHQFQEIEHHPIVDVTVSAIKAKR